MPKLRVTLVPDGHQRNPFILSSKVHIGHLFAAATSLTMPNYGGQIDNFDIRKMSRTQALGA